MDTQLLSLELDRCEELFDSAILTEKSIFSQSAFIEMIIRLDFILQKLPEKIRITWHDDVDIIEKVRDITGLVNAIRNAICHADSPKNRLGKNSLFEFNVILGYSPRAFLIGSHTGGCDYQDDTAVYYGKYRIYINRHINRLLLELHGIIEKLGQSSADI